MSMKSCPLCRKDLCLKQVNLNLAVYFCEDLKCKYPVGYECIVVERKLEDIEHDAKDLEEENFDDWLEDPIDENPQSASSIFLDSSKTGTEDNTSELIDNLVEEAVNEARRYDAFKEKNDEVDLDFDDILSFL